MAFHHTDTCIFALVLSMLLCSPASAQTQPAAREDDPTGEIIVTGVVDPLQLNKVSEGGSRLNLTPLQTPASVEILDGDAIRLRGDLTVQDAAARATGIVNTSGVFGYNLSARGFAGQNSVMQLYDGMRMYNNTLTFPADPWMAEAVEVLRGPASVLYGEAAIGGAVNVVRKQPSDEYQHALRAGLGSYGFANLAAGSGGPVTDRIGYRVDASYRQSNGWMERGDSSAIALSGALRFHPTETLSLTVSHDYSRQKPRTWFGVPLIDDGLDLSIRKNNYNVSDADLRFRDNWSQLRVEWAPSDTLTLRSTFYHLTANKYWFNSENARWIAASATAAATIRQSSFLELYHLQRQTGNRTTATLSHDLDSGIDNRFVIGADYNDITYKNVSNSGNNATRLVDIADPFVGRFIQQTGAAATQARYKNTIRQYAIFAEDRLALGDRFSLVGGLRYDRPEIAKRDYINPANDFTSTPDAVTWRLGAVLNPVPFMSLYVSYATAADPVGALVSTSLAQSAFDLSTGRQWEAGIKHVFWEGRGQWTFAAYTITKKRLLTSDPLIPSIQVQVGQQSSRGLEASLFVEPVRDLSITLNGTVLDAQYDDFAESVGGVRFQRAGNRPANIAAKSANLFVSWKFAPAWVADGGLSYVGDRFQDAANTRRLPSYTLTDFGIRWSATERLSAGVRMRNIFDEIYPRATYGATQWVLGDPRTIEVVVNAAF
ncbi:TonB-dependent receptor [Novosphingobium sp. M1R2S20]|uniref:TonB-dependent receptor n=1 Tax=Novosphingobium rhizovicinum TaxID=3228928 RepID=A0ABV3REQ5_9SPHN